MYALLAIKTTKKKVNMRKIDDDIQMKVLKEQQKYPFQHVLEKMYL